MNNYYDWWDYMSEVDFKEVDTYERIRRRLEQVFQPDTADPDKLSGVPGSGHDLMVSMLLHDLMEGEVVTCMINEKIPHYYSKVGNSFVDLTGNQHGYPAIQVSNKPLYDNSEVLGNDLEFNEKVQDKFQIFKRRYISLSPERVL
jgi:hypothetical protein